MPTLAFEELGFDIPFGRTSGNVKITCPNCRDTRSHPRDRSLSVNLDTGQFMCHYCGYSGSARRFSDEEKREYAKSMNPNRYSAPKSPKQGSLWQRPAARAKERKVYEKPAQKGEPLSPKTLAYFRARGIGPATLDAFGVRQGEMYSHEKGRPINAILFPYFCRGELRNIKSRSACKEFTLERGCELLPYHIDAIEGLHECIITEGEFDALSFAECGFNNVVSVPNGAGASLAYLDDYIEKYFDDKRTIFIAVDTDPAGVKLRDELLRRFGADRCRVVTYGEGCKDANELLQRKGKNALIAALTSAPEPRMDGVASIRDFADDLEALYLNGMQPGATLGFADLDALLSFETRRLCVVTGIPGSGKSEFIDQIAERLNLRYGWKFAYFTPENAPTFYHSVKLIEKFTGKQFGQRTLPRDEFTEATAYLDENFFYIEPKQYTLDAILECAQFLVRRKGVKVLVIDPYNRIECEAGDTAETLYISALLDQLTDFAQRNDILIILVAHPRKMLRTPKGAFEIPTLYDISGSANFFNKTDFGIVVDRDRAEDSVLVSVQKVKFKHLGRPGEARFKYDMASGRYAPFTSGQPPDFDTANHLRDGEAVRAPQSPPPPFAPIETEDQLPF